MDLAADQLGDREPTDESEAAGAQELQYHSGAVCKSSQRAPFLDARVLSDG